MYAPELDLGMGDGKESGDTGEENVHWWMVVVHCMTETQSWKKNRNKI